MVLASLNTRWSSGRSAPQAPISPRPLALARRAMPRMGAGAKVAWLPLGMSALGWLQSGDDCSVS